MVAITVDKKALSIFEEFIQNHEEFDALTKLKEFTEEEFSFSVRYKKYDSCINAPAARVIINFQNTIYRIVALHTKGKADIRLLSREEKEEFEIPFRIEKGSTIEKADKLLQTVKGIMHMIPEKQRGPTLICLAMMTFGYLGWESYIEREFELKKAEESNKALVHAMDIVKDSNDKMYEITLQYEKDLLNDLSQVDEEVELSQKAFVKEELKEVKKAKYPSNKNKDIKTIEGVFVITDINLKNRYIKIEDNKNSGPIRVDYNDDLIAQMSDINKHLKTAVENSNKKFNIKASIAIKNGKVDFRTLDSISEYNVVR